MHARIGMLRALNRNVERVFNPDRKDTNWGKQTALVVVVALEALAHSRLRFPIEFRPAISLAPRPHFQLPEDVRRSRYRVIQQR